MLRFMFVVLSILLAIMGSSATLLALTLAQDGHTQYSIVVSNRATAPEKTAAGELRSYLKQVTGADFTIKTESESDQNTPAILIGQSARVKKLLPQLDWKTLGQDGTVIRTVGNDLVLSGGRPRGTLYAVYTFLEDAVGCRWWTSTESYIPRKPNLMIGELNTKYTPKLLNREAYYIDTNDNPLFCVKLRMNGHMYRIPPSYGGHREIIGWCHTFYNLIPPKKYFKDHPEWFSLVGGKRVGENAQLCLTNQELVEEMAKVCVAEIKKNPTAGIISVSQMDWVGKCECDKCKAVEEEEGSPSGPIIRFVNAVAERVEKQCPDTLVETLAYLYSRKPPLKTRPRDNVVVRLCSIDCNFAEPYDSESNKSFRDDLAKWASISKHLFIWDYVTNFGNSIPPQANMRILAPNLRLFERSNVMGIFEQGDCECTVGDFVKYRAWLLAHLMWDPSKDENKLKTEFLNGYYGAAGPYISHYFDVIHDAIARSKAAFGCIHGNIGFWGLEDLTDAKRIMDRAEEAVKNDPTLLARVQRDRMPLDMMWLQRFSELKQTAEAKKAPFEGWSDPVKASEEFISKLKMYNAKGFGCGQNIDILINGLRAAFPPPAK